ncbi:MAG TPA: sugar transferase [Bacteroidales bacterium]|nr:sugar transferase [Bacteroidales bacterium]HQJ81780.1 sugar transferase [Bacteroidales bacterium]
MNASVRERPENIETNENTDPGRTRANELISRIAGILISLTALCVLSPLIIILSFLIKVSGKGPVIYSQDRIGKNGKPFVIYKFRSMVFNAETGLPRLSCSNEERITRIGKFLRKYRIDEIPNFINVIKGDMSIVGPRPERKFFIDQIMERNPAFSELLRIKPGITSWGQVKYGYASDVDQMLERLEYDLYYIRNKSLFLDIKILFCTTGTILKGKGL